MTKPKKKVQKDVLDLYSEELQFVYEKCGKITRQTIGSCINSLPSNHELLPSLKILRETAEPEAVPQPETGCSYMVLTAVLLGIFYLIMLV